MIDTKTSYPLYVTTDLAGQKEFYLKHFGFEAVFYDPDFYLHLLNPANGMQIGFMVPAHPAQPDFLQPPAQADGMVITFEVDSAEKAFEYALSAHLDIAMALKVEPWEQVHFMIRDPRGLVLDIVEDNH